MLKPKKKIARRDLKQDALVTTYTKVTRWYGANRKRIGTVVTVTVILVLAVVVYMRNQASDTELAAADLAKVQPYFDGGTYDLAIEGVPEMNVPGLRSIVENYGGTPPGEHARFYLANALFHQGRFEEALSEFEDCQVQGELLHVATVAGIAACFEAMGDWARAADKFEEAASMYPDNVDVPRNLNHAARNYVLAGEEEKAIELYEKLEKNHPDTPYGRQAPRYLTQLSV